eukprot:3481326-Rhodomonas_salina.1
MPLRAELASGHSPQHNSRKSCLTNAIFFRNTVLTTSLYQLLLRSALLQLRRSWRESCTNSNLNPDSKPLRYNSTVSVSHRTVDIGDKLYRFQMLDRGRGL